MIENQPMTAGIFNHYFAVFTGWAWSAHQPDASSRKEWKRLVGDQRPVETPKKRLEETGV